MPLVAHNALPTFERLRAEGEDVLSVERARAQDIRELHVGLLNMMPDAALLVTEKQYMRLIGACNRITQIYVYPFSVPGLARSAEARDHIEAYYSDFDELRSAGLDALIISGANVTNPELDLEPFWEPLREVVTWAAEHVTSILCSCLATHALVKHLHGIDRRPLGHKLWGVYRHRVCDREHPLTQDINTRFDAPHSRWNDIPRAAWDEAGLTVLAESDEAGVHLATSADGFRIVYFQGHPEYDRNSLLKEYKREVGRFLAGELTAPPPDPEHYFSHEVDDLAQSYLRDALAARAQGRADPDFPEEAMDPWLENSWGDTGRALFGNWLGLVYQLTGLDRHEPFMAGIDPADPLGRLGYPPPSSR
jgi:homoserine O-succinyltransferase/O-acetyltransferase